VGLADNIVADQDHLYLQRVELKSKAIKWVRQTNNQSTYTLSCTHDAKKYNLHHGDFPDIPVTYVVPGKEAQPVQVTADGSIQLKDMYLQVDTEGVLIWSPEQPSSTIRFIRAS
jgi:hypothetical protein